MLRDLQKEKQDKNKKDLIIFIILLVLFIPISLIYWDYAGTIYGLVIIFTRWLWHLCKYNWF